MKISRKLSALARCAQRTAYDAPRLGKQELVMIQWCYQEPEAGDRRFDIILLNRADEGSQARFVHEWRQNRRRLK